MSASTTFDLPIVGMFNPVLAGAAMALSSVSKVSNARWLKTWKPETPPQDDAQ